MRARPNLQRRVKIKTLPAPTGGLNARDAYADMPQTDAVVMENLFPMPSYVMPRNGNAAWVTGLPGSVMTLATYSPPSGSRLMFAATNGAFYDVTNSAPAGSPVVTGTTSDIWQSVNFGAGGGQYLVMVNGQDSMQIRGPSGWQKVTDTSTPISITGVATSSLVNVNVYMGRLFFIQKDSMVVWYLPLGSVGGAALSIDLSTQTFLGGSVVAMATWTLQTDNGMTQLATFITSEGEVLSFTGNDPSLAAAWTLVGTFRIGRPVGYRCTVKIGSDVAVICADGLVPLSKAALTDRQSRGIAISDKIVNLINNDVQYFAQFGGWQVLLHPIGNKVIVNVPNTSGTYQYVMNTLNGSWTKFTGWAANCWALMGDKLFYGTSTAVYQADVGLTDNGNPIQCKAIQASTNCGSDEQKMFNEVRPVFISDGPIKASIKVCPDFYYSTQENLTQFITAFYEYWIPFTPWSSPWSATQQVYKTWTPTTGIGYSGSVAIAIANQGASVQWQATDIGYTQGGPV